MRRMGIGIAGCLAALLLTGVTYAQPSGGVKAHSRLGPTALAAPVADSAAKHKKRHGRRKGARPTAFGLYSTCNGRSSSCAKGLTIIAGPKGKVLYDLLAMGAKCEPAGGLGGRAVRIPVAKNGKFHGKQTITAAGKTWTVTAQGRFVRVKARKHKRKKHARGKKRKRAKQTSLATGTYRVTSGSCHSPKIKFKAKFKGVAKFG